MKIVIDNDCGLCNKLWSIVNPIIWSIKNKKRILFISYDINYKYFPNLFFNKYLWFPFIYFYHSISYRQVHKLHIKLKKARIENNLFADLIWYGWDNIHDEINEEDKIIIRKIFKPSKKILTKIEKKFKEERRGNEIIVGIHMRVGDYISYKRGKYFFSIEEYRRIMRNLIMYFEKDIKFFIASNESINPEDFSEFNFFYFGEKTIIDLYSLSKCDYIIGPPSTFSMWAALYGGNLQSFIIQKDQKKFLFKPINKNLSLEEMETIYGYKGFIS